MNLEHLKVGDEVFVVHQRWRDTSPPRTEKQKIARVGRQYAYIDNRFYAMKFCRKTGESAHPPDSNARANCQGFDVYQSEQDYIQSQHEAAEHQRLSDRLLDNWSLKKLSSSIVQAIHSVLDQEAKQ